MGDSITDISARILVVENDHVIALDIQRCVEGFGFSTFVAHTAADAIRMATKNAVDLVLMDVRLDAQFDGIDAARAIRTRSDAAIVYLTAFADDQTLDRALATEPHAYVFQPFRERELGAAIAMSLQRRERERHQAEELERQHFLAEALTTMTATLDPLVVVRTAVDLLVPRYGDFCILHIAEGPDISSQLLVTSPRTAGDDWWADAGLLLHRVRTTKAPEIFADLAFDDVRSLLGATYVDALAKVRPQVLLCMPLQSRGQSIGALAVARGPTRPPIGDAELSFFENVAHRVADAVDNALLHRALDDASRMRDDIVGIMSHGLRTPLGMILLEANGISRGSGEVHARPASRIARATRRMNRMVGNMLDTSKIHGNDLTLDCTTCAVAPMLEEALEMFRSQAEDQSITLTARSFDQTTTLSCDRARILQVLSDLIENAFNRTPNDGGVTVTADRVADGIRFCVRDSGTAMPTAEGLSLVISRSILRAHHATLSLETDAERARAFSFVLSG